MEQRVAFRNTTFSLANDEANGCNVVGVGNEAVPRKMGFFGIYFHTQDAG